MAQPKVRQVELEYPKVFKMPNTHIEVKISVHLAIYKAMGLKMNFLQIENLQSHSPQTLICELEEKLQEITGFLLFLLYFINRHFIMKTHSKRC